ncbi:hypothetical protein [Curtobacterium sp. MCBD17_040]|uniref:hypothetical protein n=1 Tax=Curtobacterium sp. MCBD17_040 TaxID=2175674 RepID=UPI0015E8C1BF|nr:hypothetical protein [Curtobacterium sp. MCBD17_040]WIB65303.1 hypothetical protein DEI94_18020 [Curtobacterium sp. MCBD17_040]
MSDTPIYDRLFRRHVGTLRTRWLVFPETVVESERDILACADLFWGDRWWTA